MFIDKRLLVAGCFFVAVLACCAQQKEGVRSVAMQTGTAAAATSSGAAYIAPSPPPERIFSPQEVKAFLIDVRKAEAITDPLQRCLAYPDPPGSHWSREGVKAYCEYRTQRLISLDEITTLINQGKAAEVDRQLAQILKNEQSDPHSREPIEHIYVNYFEKNSDALRALVDEWKRQSPNSAFAFAASGAVYTTAAYDARGGQEVYNTPAKNFVTMNDLLTKADADLQRARAINPNVLPIYMEMIRAGAYSLGKDYALKAATRGLKINPANHGIYSVLYWFAEPEWYGNGTTAAMKLVRASAQQQANKNPLLIVDFSVVEIQEANVRDCACQAPAQPAQFPVVFDQLAATTYLATAGQTSSDHNIPLLAVVYLSEALRFDPDDLGGEALRANNMEDIGEVQMAFEEGNKLIAAYPHNDDGYNVRGLALEKMNRVEEAKRDYTSAIAINPNDAWPLIQLGDLYTNEGQSDKSAELSEKLIRQFPTRSAGWVFRANIQLAHNSPDRRATLEYLVAHFANDPDAASDVSWARQELVRMTGKTSN